MGQQFSSIPYAGPAAARYGSYVKRYMVVHCTANDATPAQEAAYARNRTDGVGMHFVSDSSTVLQVLETWYGTGHVGSTIGNRYGVSWEFVGFLSSSTQYYRACVDRAADSMRLVMAHLGIPHRWLTDGELANGVSRGLVTHAQCSRVLGGSDHTDPGPNFPHQYLIDRLNGAAVTAPFNPFADPTTRTQAQRVDALLRGDETYEVNYTATSWSADDPTNVTESNSVALGLRELRERPPTNGAEVAEALAADADFINTLANAIATRIGTIPDAGALAEAAFQGAQRAENE